MKHLAAFTIAVSLAATPMLAEDNKPSELGEGMSLVEEGTKLLLRGLMSEMAPALKGLEGMADEMGPALSELQGMIGDFTNYHMPETLPNGDIIIRRKIPLKVEPLKEGEIEL